MADEAPLGAEEWPSEDIPEQDQLFLRIEKSYVRNGTPMPGAFRNRPTDKDGMSTDWDRYSTAKATRNRGRVPSNNGVVVLVVRRVLDAPGQTVRHTPDRRLNNRAHTDVFGPKDPEVRLKLLRAAKWVPGYELL